MKFGLVVLGAHFGVWLADVIEKYKNDNILLVEPVPYNYKILKKNPQQFIKLLPTFLESMIITAELSKYKVNGLKGAIRLKGLMLVYFITFFQWMEDKDSSLEKTMTALDKNLDQAEKLIKIFL